MSNSNFDQLFKAQMLEQSREILAGWEASRARTDLTAAEIDFLDRAIANSRIVVELRKQALRSIHI